MQCSFFFHGGFGDIFLIADNVAVLLDDVGESRCTRISTLGFLLLHPRSWVEVTHRSRVKQITAY